MANIIEGDQNARGLRFGLVVSRFNDFITSNLLTGSLDVFSQCGVDEADLKVLKVPGAFELPQAARKLCSTGNFDAVVCLGAVIRGETTHDQHINTAVANGIETAGRQYGIPVLFGLLTCDTLKQAEARAGGDVGNKGAECAEAAIAMINLLQDVSGQ